MPRRPAHPTYRALLERIADLEAEVARLRDELAAARGEDEPPAPAGDGGQATVDPPAGPRKRPPGWAKSNVVVVERRRPRKPRAPVSGRRRDVPDRIVVHAPAVCGGCGAALGGGRLVGRRQIIDLPPVRAEIVEHQARERRCRGCGWVGRGQMPDLGAEAGPHRRFGWGVAAWAATLRTHLRLPVRQVEWLLERGFGARVSIGALSGLFDAVARAGEGAYERLLAEARASPVVHMDETGWRENGRNGYVWTVSAPTTRVFSSTKSRGGAVAERLLGTDGTAVVVSDFYAGYDRLARVQQWCWAHLLRDIADLVADHPDDREVTAWAKAVKTVFAMAVAWADRATATGVRPICRERVADRFAAALVDLCRQPAGSPQSTLCRRIERYRTDLFPFIADPTVPPTNNAAERALRPLVIARTISAGSRSKRGSRTRMVLQSLVATWTLRGLDPVAQFRELLSSPPSDSSTLAPL